MLLKNIVIDSVDGIDDREMYRFITKELFLVEVDNCFPKNMIVGFIYEEFYPNDECDIKRNANVFMDNLTDKGKDHIDMYISSGNNETKEIQIENLKRNLSLFRDAFDEIRKEKFSITSLSILGETAELIFDFELSVKPTGSKSFQHLRGLGKFSFIKEYDFWVIEEMMMEGVV